MQIEKIKTYELRHFDTTLIVFTATNTSDVPDVKILWVNEDKKAFLPLELELTEEGIASYLKHRVIPKNRAYVHQFLTTCGLGVNRPMNIINVSKGLSLNDCYWIVEKDFNGLFANYNLYENRFSRILSLIAFTGYGSDVKSSLLSSPEFTTNGMLPKCWRRQQGKVLLYKGGTKGASNLGFEPYSEFYAPQIASVLGINAISYGLSKWKGELCSTCELFTSKDISFIPVGRLVKKGGFNAVWEYYKSLGPIFEKAFNNMIVFDAIICNTDRHYGNFGVLVDSKTNKIIAPAPLFDHGNSLFNYAGEENLVSNEILEKYITENLFPRVYDDFIETAKEHLDDDLRKNIKKLFNFKFRKHSRYNLNNNRLHRLEHQIQERAKALLM